MSTTHHHLAKTSTTDSSQANDTNFQEGLNKIIKTYESQLGRTLEAEEVGTITAQARKFYENNQQQEAAPIINQQTEASTTIDSSSSLSTGPTDHHQQSSLTQDGDNEEEIKPTPYPMDFYELARLISSSSSMGNNDQLLSILSSQTNLPGLKSIPNILNDQKPSSPVLAHQAGAGKKPWETRLEQSKPQNH